MNSAILFTVTALVNSLWQPALIAAIAWVALKLSRCNNATTRHAVWTLALIASAVVPIVSALPVVWPQTVPAAQHTASLTVRGKTLSEPIAPVKAKFGLPSAVEHDATISSAASIAIPQRPNFYVQPTVALVVAILWLAVALVILGRLLVSFLYLERLKHDALPLAVEARHALTRYDRAGKGDRDVRICVSGEITVPVAVGIFDAMILIPSDFVSELDENDLDRILLHELAHVRRSDDWVNLFERIAQALYFFSPGIYWISRQMDLEREVACDDWVLEQSAENVPYARCLARIVEMTQWPYTAPAAPGVFVTRKSMSIRIERLLARGRDIRIRLAVVPSLLSLLFIAAVVVAGGFVSPTIAYTLDQSVARHEASPRVHTTMVPADFADRVKTHVLDTIAAKVAVSTAPLVAKYTAKAAPIAAKQVALQVPKLAASITPVATSNAVAAAAQAFDETDKDSSRQVADDPSYLDELAAAGYKNLTVDEIIELKSVGVDGAYIRGLATAGFKNLTTHELVELKSLGVDGSYVKSLRDAGYTNIDAHDVESLRALGIDGSYIKSMRDAGLRNLTPHDLQGLRGVGVDPEYISKMRAAGFSDLDAHDLESLRGLGIDPDYVAHMRSMFGNTLTLHDIESMRGLGIDGDYIKDLSNAGYPNLTARDLESLKGLGVDGDYVRKLKAHGFNNLSVRDLERFKAADVIPQ